MWAVEEKEEKTLQNKFEYLDYKNNTRKDFTQTKMSIRIDRLTNILFYLIGCNF